ncbi:hypothetical protein [Changchengzhania lutea]|uniref:hypothetical protein n=1 Tax=Changchengzhania lutea TaxID=2049305 RepID=UPI00115E6B65|nr:hypothetical protein [Changchengzhania lutea]
MSATGFSLTTTDLSQNSEINAVVGEVHPVELISVVNQYLVLVSVFVYQADDYQKELSDRIE